MMTLRRDDAYSPICIIGAALAGVDFFGALALEANIAAPLSARFMRKIRIIALSLLSGYWPRISISPSMTFATSAGGMRPSRLPIRSTDKVRI